MASTTSRWLSETRVDSSLTVIADAFDDVCSHTWYDLCAKLAVSCQEKNNILATTTMLHVSTYIHDEVAGSINQAFLSLSGYLKHLESLSKVRQEKDNLAHKAKV